MNIYAGLIESMMACCDRIGVRHAPVYTLSMLALALGFSLNILSVIDLLWTLGVLSNPYGTVAGLHPQRYLGAALCIAFVVNAVLVRLNFSAVCVPRRTASAVAAPAYMLGSAGLFLVTLTLSLRHLA